MLKINQNFLIVLSIGCTLPMATFFLWPIASYKYRTLSVGEKLTETKPEKEENLLEVMWTFWDSGVVPPIIEMCKATIKCHNHPHVHLQMVRENELHQWVPNVHPAFPLLIPAHKADYFRARILDEYGGIYVDSDSIGFSSTYALFDKLRWYDLVSYTWDPDGDPISIGILGPMRSHLHFTARWVTQLHLILDRKLKKLKDYRQNSTVDVQYPIQWAEICRNIVQPEIRKQIEGSITYFSINGGTTIGQISNSFSAPLKEDTKLNFTQATNYFWYHSKFAKTCDSWRNVTDIMSQNYVLVELLAMSFKECRLRMSNTAKYDSVIKPRKFVLNKHNSTWTKDNPALRKWTENLLNAYKKHSDHVFQIID